MPGPGRPKGQPKTGGRRPGSIAKDKADLLDLCRRATRRKQWDPVVAMAVVATNPKLKGSTLELRFSAMREVAKYLRPRLKAIEHSGAIEVGMSGVLRVPQPAIDAEEWERLVQDEPDHERDS